MKSGMITIIKKEFARFFGDKRMLLTTLLLPGLMIYLMYTLMGSAMSDSFTTADDYKYKINAVNLPAEMTAVFPEEHFTLTKVEADTKSTQLELLESKSIDLYIVFPVGFYNDIIAFNTSSGAPAPNIDIYFNSIQTSSSDAYNAVTALLSGFESSLSNRFDINAGEEKHDVATEKQTSGMIFSMMLPMLLMTFMYSGCMAVVTESIAGEKERGTIATLLVTPLARKELVMGKVFSLSALALLSGISSFLGTMLSLPKLMGDTSGVVDASIYTATDYFALLAVILSTILVIVSVISILSAFAKTVKEASTLVMPMMILVMLIGITSMFSKTTPNLFAFFIPLYNSVMSMSGIFSFNYQAVNIAVTVCTNIVVSAALMLVLTRMFNSEKIMFAR